MTEKSEKPTKVKLICPYCKKEVEFQHSIELWKSGYFRKTYAEMVWEYCPECTRVISYAKYDMEKDMSIRATGLSVYKSKKVYGGLYDDRS